MLSLVVATFIALPLYPVNPIRQDTLALLNAHVTAGITAPDGIVNTGLELTSKWELVLVHPILIRAGIDYRFGPIMALRFPDGILHGSTLSLEALVYRGTNRMTGFVGGGIVLNKYFLHMTRAAADSMMANYHIYGVYVDPALGYRISMGLRLRRAFSIELAVTALSTDFLFRESLGLHRYSQRHEPARFRDFRVSLGYVFPIWNPGR